MIDLLRGRDRDPLVRAITFPLRLLLMTPGVRDSIPPIKVMQALRRHANGDWGNLDDDDRAPNDQALTDGTRLLSSYHTRSGTKFWIITEADRSATTALFPEKY